MVYKMAKKHTKRCSISLVIREMSIITRHPPEWLERKRQTMPSVIENAEKPEPSFIAGGDVDGSVSGAQLGSPS